MNLENDTNYFNFNWIGQKFTKLPYFSSTPSSPFTSKVLFTTQDDNGTSVPEVQNKELYIGEKDHLLVCMTMYLTYTYYIVYGFSPFELKYSPTIYIPLLKPNNLHDFVQRDGYLFYVAIGEEKRVHRYLFTNNWFYVSFFFCLVMSYPLVQGTLTLRKQSRQ